MSQPPTGFGSVPCERLEVSLDGERLALLDWRGGGRQDAAVCRGQKTAAVNSGQSGSISAGKMQVQFRTTAGMHALGAAWSTQVGKQKVAGRLDRGDFDFVFDRKLENVAVPIEVVPPYSRGNLLDALPRPGTEFRLVPRTRRKARDAKVDARHLLVGPQLRHAGKPAPRTFEATRIAIYDSDVTYALEP